MFQRRILYEIFKSLWVAWVAAARRFEGKIARLPTHLSRWFLVRASSSSTPIDRDSAWSSCLLGSLVYHISIAVINVIAIVAVIIFIIIIIVSKRSTATIIIQLWRRRARPDAVPTNILCAREEVMKKEKTAVWRELYAADASYFRRTFSSRPTRCNYSARAFYAQRHAVAAAVVRVTQFFRL